MPRHGIKSDFLLEFEATLIEEIRKRPAVWDKGNPFYSMTQTVVARDWRNIQNVLKDLYEHRDELVGTDLLSINRMKGIFKSKKTSFKAKSKRPTNQDRPGKTMKLHLRCRMP